MTSARLAPAHAVFGLRTPNLGDDLQALTVATISPYVSTLINRERIGWRQVSEPHVFVMNFWFMSGGYRWAPHETIRPIFHGFCIGRDEVLNIAGSTICVVTSRSAVVTSTASNS